MTVQQKKAYMKDAVTPTMKPIFRAFDAKEVQDRQLRDLPRHATAGGPQVQDASNDIHPLPATKKAFEAKVKTEPNVAKWTEFMALKVEPAHGQAYSTARVSTPRSRIEGAFQAAANIHKPRPRSPDRVGSRYHTRT
jgi:hypothetical protein